MQGIQQRKQIFYLHLSFWCLYFSFFFYQITGGRHGSEPNLVLAFWDATTHVLLMAFIAYLNYFIFLPRFLEHRQVGRFLVEFLLPFVLIVAGHIWLKRFIYGGAPYRGFLYSDRFIIQHVLITLFIVIFVGMLKFVEDWFDLQAKKKEIENERLNAELRFLKAQINPHFLFNTLNNLYYLAFTNSPNTTTVIEKLSQMMRYMIYDSNQTKVSLNKEIEYMKNYISLEQLRLNNQIPICFEVEGTTGHQLIVPFIFITFLENAFKHGVSNSFEEAWVHVRIRVEGNECTYTVENSKLPQREEEALEKSGIGLQNVHRRLELSYPGAYTLQVDNQPDRYAVQLQLTLL
ncbi:sensor histidine kinase [Telluribacter sp. SYSU D00476]|uniref:sensor histidine kinase n=1 Tax=Telluribacter sp. SYSU D00476 TaxID=2811430 RepID=UPI001FF53CFF|nr:histidine kinase [Telluribacter sp. SYSU D00476]